MPTKIKPPIKYKKPLCIILLCLAVAALSCLVIILNFDGYLCENKTFQEVYSPDKHYKAVVFLRNCGGASGYSTQVSLLKASKALPDKPDIIFAMTEHPNWTHIHVYWYSDDLLVIRYNGQFGVFFQKDDYHSFFNTIRIEYINLPGDD